MLSKIDNITMLLLHKKFKRQKENEKLVGIFPVSIWSTLLNEHFPQINQTIISKSIFVYNVVI